PVVTITSPANNSVFTSGPTIPIVIHSTDADGTISKVELFRNRILIATANPNSADSTVTANVLSTAGDYMYTANATDNLGVVTISAPLHITFNAAPTVTLISPTEG